ncbi:hypothetical protein LH464_19085 [Neorhizobium sp. T786]|uniref:hypothetical protein n=1 Tax=Pseudorhizobium xiangyangii TaxID=2883104 RepID=UPI001D0008A6|nr:hypothetical protein [Neorhizobium xiangyangii]MCB5204575.1 hypothetical protein [Neorhizobium xiangyangii]
MSASAQCWCARLEDDFRISFFTNDRIAFAFPDEGACMMMGEFLHLQDGGFLRCGEPGFERLERLTFVIEIESYEEYGGKRYWHRETSGGSVFRAFGLLFKGFSSFWLPFVSAEWMRAISSSEASMGELEASRMSELVWAMVSSVGRSLRPSVFLVMGVSILVRERCRAGFVPARGRNEVRFLPS